MGGESRYRYWAGRFWVVLLWLGLFGCERSHGRDEPVEPLGPVHGVLFVMHEGAPHVVELDAERRLRPLPLDMGPATIEQLLRVRAIFSPDGRRLAYRVDARDVTWFAVAEGPDWDHPLTEHTLEQWEQSAYFAWLGDAEIVVGLRDGFQHRHRLDASAPEALGPLRYIAAAPGMRLAIHPSGGEYLLLRAGAPDATLAIEEPATGVFLSPEGTRAALVWFGLPREVPEGVPLEVTPIGWTPPADIPRAGCITEMLSCPITPRQPFSHVAQARWTPDGHLIAEVELKAGEQNASGATYPVPHPSGYALHVVQAGRPLLLGPHQASPSAVALSAGPVSAPDPPLRSIWAWGAPFADVWGVLDDGRVYYVDWGESSSDYGPGSADAWSIRLLPSATAPLDEAMELRPGGDSAVHLAQPTRDQRHLLCVARDTMTHGTRLSSIALDGPVDGAGDEHIIVETEQTLGPPRLAPSGAGILVQSEEYGVPGTQCYSCAQPRWHLAPDASSEAVALPAGLSSAWWSPDGAGVFGLLEGELVYFPLDAPDRIEQLLPATQLMLPAVWQAPSAP